MKVAHYPKVGGGTIDIEYDETAPCTICGEPVVQASMGGTVVCPWCDCGRCRYCGISIYVLKKEIDGGRSLQELRDHMRWHHQHEKQVQPSAKNV